MENYVINLNMGLLESTYLRGVPVIVNNGYGNETISLFQELQRSILTAILLCLETAILLWTQLWLLLFIADVRKGAWALDASTRMLPFH